MRLYFRLFSENPLLLFVPKHIPSSESQVKILQECVDGSSKMFIITGAGVSTESGIPDYRSEGVGLYSRSNHRPMKLQEFLASRESRKRYWARNFIGWPRFSSSQPNINHRILREWELSGKVNCLVTQNVDGLHKKAGSLDAVELHGSGFLVRCLNCDYSVDRHEFQLTLENLNPHLSLSKISSKNSASEIRPDGDINLAPEDVINFTLPDCPTCLTGILQPNIVFFGDNVNKDKVNFLYEQLNNSDAVFVMGSSLQVFSSFRFILRAQEMNIPIVIMTIGPTRGDKFAKLILTSRLGDILQQIRI